MPGVSTLQQNIIENIYKKEYYFSVTTWPSNRFITL